MPPPRLYPRDVPRPTTSEAERAVFAALKAGLPKGWFAWHSLRLRDARGVDGEADFVILDPERGLLLLEVKGGRIEVAGGRWRQNGRDMDRSPREQALGFAKKLASRLRDDGQPVPRYGVATCFPDTAFDAGPSQGDVRGLVLGQQDLSWLSDALPGLMSRAIPEARAVPPKTPDTLHGLWCETWKPRLSLGRQASQDAHDRLRLDEQQLSILDALAGNDRLLVKGPAGSGKTILAAEAARRAAAGGRSALLLCFTDALAASIRRELGPDGVQVEAIRDYSARLLREAGAKAPTKGDAKGWSDAPVAAADLVQTPFDAVVIDEAQDFSESDWLFVDALCGSGRLWAFADGAQAFWDERVIAPDLFSAHFKLMRCYRSPESLWGVARAYVGAPVEALVVHNAIEARTLSLVGCPSETAVKKKVIAEVAKLRSEGFAPADIAIISLRGQTATDSVIRDLHIPGADPVRADAPDAGTSLVADTFLRFKGLERPAVIVTDLRLVQDKRDIRMHIALTRALTTATVVAPRDVLRDDPVLGGAAQAGLG